MIWPALVALLCSAALAGCSFEAEQEVWEISGPVFGTQYHVKVVLTDDEGRLEDLAGGITGTLEDVDEAMSTWREDSELSRFNSHEQQGDWFPVSDPLFEVLAEAQRISQLSDGAFDITVGPVVNLWGFGPEARPDQVPEDDLLATRLANTGYEKLELNASDKAIRSDDPLYLDLSAIGKGYAVDAVARYLKDAGIDAFLVEIGGEVNAKGRKPDGDVWRLAIEKPVSRERTVQRIVALENRAMATSGDYRNYYEADGKRYSHTIDPATGRPIKHRLASVSVIAEDSMTADALATTFNVMGEERGYTFAVQHDIAAYFIFRGENGFESKYTPAFSSYLMD
ncbi:FAD:protein FMN transferase [Marinobacter fonticola]|uniref:FAD:protein FMN transferase n=1 Tax=Marinobacter fonticola TaxID=2603215 RepID=UPI001D0D842F|nr:FAD:protein FMN transferase [Marinobacter fonticola]